MGCGKIIHISSHNVDLERTCIHRPFVREDNTVTFPKGMDMNFGWDLLETHATVFVLIDLSIFTLQILFVQFNKVTYDLKTPKKKNY